MSELFYLGHDGFLLKDNNFSLVLDYWDLKSKAFQGNWVRSEKIELSKEIRKVVYNPKYVWVSHEHTDHFDPIYLKQLNANTTLLLPKFIDDFFQSKYGFSENDEKLFLRLFTAKCPPHTSLIPSKKIA